MVGHRGWQRGRQPTQVPVPCAPRTCDVIFCAVLQRHGYRCIRCLHHIAILIPAERGGLTAQSMGMGLKGEGADC